MPKYEIAIAVKDEDDHMVRVFRKKEGDIISVRPYPNHWGRKSIDEYFVVIVECAVDSLILKQRLTEPLWENGLIWGIDFRKLEYDRHHVDQVQYPVSEYCWHIKNQRPIKRPKMQAKRRYRIPLDRFAILDKAKVQNKKYIYQPFKKASQLVQRFDGLEGRHYLEKKEVDCVAPGIGEEQEFVVLWTNTNKVVMDKYTNSYIGPDSLK